MKNKKINFSITDSLGAWTNQNGQELNQLEILKAETISVIEVQSGIKYKGELKYLLTDALIQAASCGFTSSGSTTLSKKEISVKSYQVAESLCPADLEDTALSLSMKPGWNEELPFEAAYVAGKIANIQKQVEQKIWNNASGATEFSGLFEQFDLDSAVVDVVASFTGTTVTGATLIALYDEMIDAIPAEIVSMGDLMLFMGHDQFRKLSKAFLATNNVLLTKFDFNGVDVFEYPGSEFVKIMPVNGLNADVNTLKRAVITPSSNLVYVTDMTEEETATDLWYSKDDQLVKFITRWKSGVAYKFGEYVVVSQNA